MLALAVLWLGKQKNGLQFISKFQQMASCCWYLCDLHYCTKTIFTITSYLHCNYVYK